MLGYNHSKEVEILPVKLGIKLLFLPPYSPNLKDFLTIFFPFVLIFIK